MGDDEEFYKLLPTFDNITLAKEYCAKTLGKYELTHTLKLSEILSFLTLDFVRMITSNPELKEKIKYNEWRKTAKVINPHDIEAIINAKKS